MKLSKDSLLAKDSQSFEIEGEPLALSLRPVDDEVFDFFIKHCEDFKVPCASKREFMISQFNSGPEFKSLRTTAGDIIALSIRDLSNIENGSLGTIMVREDYRKKGIASLLLNNQISDVLAEDPGKKSMEGLAVSKEGFMLAVSTSVEVKDRINIVLSISREAILDIIYDIFSRFTNLSDLSFEEVIYSLEEQGRLQLIFNEKKLKYFFGFDETLELEGIPLVHKIIFLLLSAGNTMMADFIRTEDNDALLINLKKIGIIIIK